VRGVQKKKTQTWKGTYCRTRRPTPGNEIERRATTRLRWSLINEKKKTGRKVDMKTVRNYKKEIKAKRQVSQLTFSKKGKKKKTHGRHNVHLPAGIRRKTHKQGREGGALKGDWERRAFDRAEKRGKTGGAKRPNPGVGSKTLLKSTGTRREQVALPVQKMSGSATNLPRLKEVAN